MRFHTYLPEPPLSRFVSLFWYCDGYVPQARKERVLPTGTVELIVNLRENATRVYEEERCERFPGIVLCGPHARPFVIDAEEQFAVAGIHFKPGGAFPFLGPSAGEFRDRHVALEDLWGRWAPELRERLALTPDPQGKLRLLAGELMRRAVHPLSRHPAVSLALAEFGRAPGEASVGDVVEKAGLSRRRFIELFTREVGLTPKLFCRVLRFQEIIRRVHAEGKADWAELALWAGYSDQAHFTRDFRDFSGMSPTTYLARRGDHLNHVALVE